MPRKSTIDLNQVEDLAARGLSDVAISAALGKNRQYVATTKAVNEEFYAALLRGRQRLNAGAASGSGGTEPKPAANDALDDEFIETPIDSAEDDENTEERELTREEFYEFGKEKLSHTEIAARIGYPNNIGISQLLHKFPELKEALDRGKNGQPLDDEILTADFDEKLLEAHFDCVNTKKLFFLRDIAGYLGCDWQLSYKYLAELVRTKRLLRDESGDTPRYFTPRDDEPVAAQPAGAKRFENLSDSEIEQGIFAAVDAGYCAINQIKRFNGWALAVDLSENLEALIDNSLLQRVTNEMETITGFFRCSRLPKTNGLGLGKFFTNGTLLVVEYEDDGGGGVAAEPSKPKETAKSSTVSRAPQIPAAAPTESPLEKPTPGKPEQAPDPYAVPLPSAEEFERFGSEGVSYAEIAASLGLTDTGLTKVLDCDPKLKGAYYRGVEQSFAEAGDDSTLEDVPELPAETEVLKFSEIYRFPDVADVELDAPTGEYETGDEPAAPPAPEETENQSLVVRTAVEGLATSDPTARDAWSDESNNAVQLLSPETPAAEELDQLPEARIKTVDLGRAGSVDISVSVDLLETEDDDLAFLLDLRGVMRRHRARLEGGAR